MTCLEPGKPAQQPIAIPHAKFALPGSQKFSCSHHQFMLDLFRSTCGEQTRSACRAPTRQSFGAPKTFHHHLARVVPHSAKLSAKCAFPATSLACDNSCTTHVAVINSLLDNLKSSRSNPVCAKKFLREVFHAAKYFVLVCRLFYLLKFSSFRHPLPANGRRSALIKRVENF